MILMLMFLRFIIVLNRIQAIRVFDYAIRNFNDARGRFLFSFTSKNTVLNSIEKSDDNGNHNRDNVLSV